MPKLEFLSPQDYSNPTTRRRNRGPYWAGSQLCPCQPGRRADLQIGFQRPERQKREKRPRHGSKEGQFRVLGFCGEAKPRYMPRGSTQH